MIANLSGNQVARAPLSTEQQLRASLEFDQIETRLTNVKHAHARTCEWLKKKGKYLDLLNLTEFLNYHGFLWVKEKPETGKSTLMKYILTQAQRTMKNRIILPFFFNARGERLEKCTAEMYRSLLLQLLERISGLRATFDSLRLPPRGDQIQWSVELLKDLFEQAILSLGQSRVVYFIDALDECAEDKIRDMLSFFQHMGDSAVASNIWFQVCFSSRHYPHITITRGLQLVLESQEGHNQDIISYIDSKLRIEHSEVAEEIKAELRTKAFTSVSGFLRLGAGNLAT